MSDASIKIGIVGLGNIGYAYDRDSPDSFARTHASAAELHPDVEIVWGADISTEARDGFRAKHGIDSFASVEEAIASGMPDVVVLAVGPEQRRGLWSKVIKAGPKVVISEKPLASTAAESREYSKACADAGVGLLVNYPRRFSAQSQRAKHLIENGEIGELRSGHVWYGKGVSNSGSHLINLLIYLFGDGWSVDQVEALDAGHLNGDINASFRMSRGDSSIMFSPLDVGAFEFAEIDLIFESGRLRFVDHAHSLVEQIGLESAGFEGMSQLVDEKLLPDDSVRDYELNVLNFVVERIKDGNGIDGEVADAISTAELVETVQRAISGSGDDD